MKKQFLIYALAIYTFIGCTDNSGLYGLLNDYDLRITKLGKLCDQLNTNISSLQVIIEAQQTGDYITAITPIKENGVEIGYTIAFANHAPVTIYHGHNGTDGTNGRDGTDGRDGVDGTNGQDGHSPIVGVAVYDGIYYWTLDGQWLLDATGNKIRVTGQDGQNGQDGSNGRDGVDGRDGIDGTNGITPQLKIENDYWYISYNNGATWTQLGKAKGDNGRDGTDGRDGIDGQNGQDGDSMFQSVTQDENNVYFTLVDGTIITISKNMGEASGDNSTMESGHKYVDLGLPSGTMWGTCNLGGSTPGDYGDYFAFGATVPASQETPTSFIVNGIALGSGGGSIAGTIYDAARLNWGGRWRMPTTSEWEELKNNCTYCHTTAVNNNGITFHGILLKSNINGNQLFLVLDDFPNKVRGMGETYIRYQSYGRYLTADLETFSSTSYTYKSYVINLTEYYNELSVGYSEQFAFQANSLTSPHTLLMVRPVFHP